MAPTPNPNDPQVQAAKAAATNEQAENLTLNKALDEAVSRLPFFRRAATKWKLRNEQFREGVLLELGAKLADDPKMQSMNVRTFAAAEGPQVVGHHVHDHEELAAFADTPIGIDPARLSEFLDLILKYLPAIIDLITKLFPK